MKNEISDMGFENKDRNSKLEKKISGTDWENIRNEEMKKKVGFLSFFGKCSIFLLMFLHFPAPCVYVAKRGIFKHKLL